eukprot:TRINITY_DN3336_c0_g1_i1.p1 TRINITY_DN3336_c0_g1~~TRINITY_DN3336_c0_g1_i1.p1  ORF type:complete len:215 (-),score=50.99 TRINITY_DN3336_c0_g1_i1:104-748(-)
MTVKGENLSKVQTLQRHVSNTLMRRKHMEEVTRNCSDEFEFVRFDITSEPNSFDFGEDDFKAETLKRDKAVSGNDIIEVDSIIQEEIVESCGENAIIDTKTRKGILWQRTDNIFSSWQERFFVLTENSLYSFLRGAKNRADLERTVSKIKLSDVCGISLVDRKGQLMIKIVTKKNGRYFYASKKGYLIGLNRLCKMVRHSSSRIAKENLKTQPA